MDWFFFISIHKINLLVVGRHYRPFFVINPFITDGVMTKHVFRIEAADSGATGSFIMPLSVVYVTPSNCACLTASCVISISLSPYINMNFSEGIVCDVWERCDRLLGRMLSDPSMRRVTPIPMRICVQLVAPRGTKFKSIWRSQLFVVLECARIALSYGKHLFKFDWISI